MANWQPITLDELVYNRIQPSASKLVGEQWRFWHLIQIPPEKWVEHTFGDEGGGFWVVAICGKQIIWYNDIEEGFNISSYGTYGSIDEYNCNQSDLRCAVLSLFDVVRSEDTIVGDNWPPII